MNPTTDKRDRLVSAAARLLHEQGYETTSLADIARRAEVPVGNVYYYFKTKAEIAAAVIDRRRQGFDGKRAEWEAMSGPKDRLLAFVEMTSRAGASLARHGCPVGSLCSEMQKRGDGLAKAASLPFAEILNWLESNFAALGKGKASHGLAVHLLASLQGVSLLANSFGDADLVRLETNHLKQWIRDL